MVNQVMLLGRLGADPELRYTANQTAMCNFRIATSEKRKDASGEWKEHTEWHTIVCFGKTAENAGKYLAKGKQVFVQGKIQTRKWQDKEGADRYSTEILANSITFIGSSGESAENTSASSQTRDTGSAPQSSRMSSAAPVDHYQSGQQTVSFDDDDIPF